MIKKIDLLCFSYLASAKVFIIDKYPKINSGAKIYKTFNSLSADGPLVAIIVTRLGLKTCLLSNQVGRDKEGREIIQTFKKNKVINLSKPTKEQTPSITVLSDKKGNRVWLAYLKEIEKELLKINLSITRKTQLVYIDFYEIIKQASLRIIKYVNHYDIPIFLNLSEKIPSKKTVNFLRNKNIVILQISLSESQEKIAEKYGYEIYQTIRPKILVTTLGRKGAMVFDGKRRLKENALQVKVLHGHGAGAAFSAGFSYGYLKKLSLEKTLKLACVLGSLNCAQKHGYEEINLKEVKKIIGI